MPVMLRKFTRRTEQSCGRFWMELKYAVVTFNHSLCVLVEVTQLVANLLP